MDYIGDEQLKQKLVEAYQLAFDGRDESEFARSVGLYLSAFITVIERLGNEDAWVSNFVEATRGARSLILQAVRDQDTGFEEFIAQESV